jgi:hypothetical protein
MEKQDVLDGVLVKDAFPRVWFATFQQGKPIMVATTE